MYANKLNVIFLKRLDRIRNGLNRYMDFYLISSKKIQTLNDISEEIDEGDDEDDYMFPKAAETNFSNIVSISDFLRRNTELNKILEKKEETFAEMLFRMIDERGIKDSDVYKLANIDRRLFSKIRKNVDYVPSKKTAISLCLALRLELDEAKKLLDSAGYTLSSSSKFDLIIMYLIKKSEYNIHFVNIVLNDYGEGTLSR